MIDIVIAEKKWRTPGLAARLEEAAMLALKKHKKAKVSLTLLLADDGRLQELNRDFRGKNKSTNVLSFPADDDAYLGDIALAYGVTAREAKAAKKTIADHATHLVVHGVLHLLGYDHETARDAEIMEPLEVQILAKLGISDPYRVRA
ncbi:MAG TPA: rRNA maturation RNase YbeY [Rhizomicrobium sp.]|jgi:probable rRNA maturation factor